MKTILFDIDSTLVDTKKLISEFIHPALIKHLDIEAEEYKKLFRKYRSTLSKGTEFDPWKLLKMLAEEFDADQAKLERVFFKKKFYTQSLYQESLPILKNYKKTFKLGIYSEGVEKWQKRKLKLCGIDKFFEKDITFISKDKKADRLINRLPKNAIIIDDRVDYLNKLSKRKDLYLVWIDRKQHGIGMKVHTIYNLTELLKMIK